MIKTIIIDDELQSVSLLQHLLTTHCPKVDIIGAFTDSVEGVKQIKAMHPELVFLDIEMPKLNGFDVLTLCDPVPFKTIFTTAYNEYAIKAFKFSALDYLLKPIHVEDLCAAVDKVQNSNTNFLQHQYQIFHQFNPKVGKTPGKLVIPTIEGLIFLDLEEIIHCDSDGSYTKIYLSNKEMIMASKSLKEMESMLEMNFFFRTHYSHIVNLNHIKKFNKADSVILMSDGSNIPVSRSKKQDFLDLLTKN